MPSYKLLDDIVVARTAAASAGWTAFTTLQQVFDYARTQDRTLVFQPGVYASGTTTILTTNGSGKPLHVRALPGSVTLQFNGSNIFLRIEGQANVRFEGLIFDGQNRALTDFVGGRKAFIAVANNASKVVFDNCDIRNSPGIGLYVTNGATADIVSCSMSTHNVGIWSENGQIRALRNRLNGMSDNGIAVWRSSNTGDSSIIVGNTINGITNISGGTGEYGNGISVFRAIGLTISENQIYNATYSAIRCNGGGGHTVTNNNIYNMREVAIFLEAPGVGIDMTGIVCANNAMDTVGNGISVANSGQFNDGTARSVVIEGNRISNVLNNPIPDAGYFPPSTIGCGIHVEQDCTITGNLVEGAARIGLWIGTSTACRDLVVSGNLVRNAPIGIGVSENAFNEANRSIVVSANVVRSAGIGGIVPILFTGTTVNRVGTVEYGNNLATTAGSVTLGHNRYV
ncbi:MAG: TIGR03808 family TAT-translocated repetitive protein [Bosea sp. (in: a-proteobacteria)]